MWPHPGSPPRSLDGPAGRHVQRDVRDLGRRRGGVPHRDGDPERLARDDEPIVGARVDHEALRERERRLDVRLLVVQPFAHLRARDGVGDERSRRSSTARTAVSVLRRWRPGLGKAPQESNEARAASSFACASPRAAPSPEPAGAKRARPASDVSIPSRTSARGPPGASARRRAACRRPPRDRGRRELAGALAAVHRPRAAAELLPRHAQQRIVDAGRHADRRAARPRVDAADPARVDLPRLPRSQAPDGAARGSAPGRPRRGRPRGRAGRPRVVLPAARPLERQRQDDVRPERAHDAHDVAERVLAAPLREGLLDAEREAELVRAAEVLLHPVVAVQRVELRGAQHAERVEQLGADRVLPAFAARQREERRAHAEAAREPNENAVVLVVRVRRHVQHARPTPSGRSARPRPTAPRSRSSGACGAGWGEAAVRIRRTRAHARVRGRAGRFRLILVRRPAPVRRPR